MAPLCDDDFEPYTGGFYIRIIPIVLLSILQIALLVHTIYHEIQLRDDEKFRAHGIKIIRVVYLGMQFTALMHIISYLARYLHEESFPCKFMSYFVYDGYRNDNILLLQHCR